MLLLLGQQLKLGCADLRLQLLHLLPVCYCRCQQLTLVLQPASSGCYYKGLCWLSACVCAGVLVLPNNEEGRPKTSTTKRLVRVLWDQGTTIQQAASREHAVQRCAFGCQPQGTAWNIMAYDMPACLPVNLHLCLLHACCKVLEPAAVPCYGLFVVNCPCEPLQLLHQPNSIAHIHCLPGLGDLHMVTCAPAHCTEQQEQRLCSSARTAQGATGSRVLEKGGCMTAACCVLEGPVLAGRRLVCVAGSAAGRLEQLSEERTM